MVEKVVVYKIISNDGRLFDLSEKAARLSSTIMQSIDVGIRFGFFGKKAYEVLFG